MPNKMEGSPTRICGQACPLHEDAVCSVAYSDTTRRGPDWPREASRWPMPPNTTVHFFDASQPHPHHHWYVLKDETLLMHRWGLAGFPEEWTARRPDGRPPSYAVPERVREHAKRSMPELPGSHEGLMRPEEWEWLRRKIGVKSTNPIEYWRRHDFGP